MTNFDLKKLKKKEDLFDQFVLLLFILYSFCKCTLFKLFILQKSLF